MYADVNDQASELETKEREAAIAAVRSAPAALRTGRCHWCDAQIAADAVYCDNACQADHAKALQAAKRNGLRLPLAR